MVVWVESRLGVRMVMVGVVAVAVRFREGII
jgi:hypothetical protein